MNFWLRFLQTFLDKWYIPIATAIVVACLTGIQIKNPREFVRKASVPLFLAILLPTLILTVVEGEPDPKNDVFIRSVDSTWLEGEAGLASLYDGNTMPFWFDSYFEEVDGIVLYFEIDNIGKSYANIVRTKLVVDNYEPITMDDVLLFRGLILSGVPDTVKSSVNISDIREGRSEYDVDFTIYEVNTEGESGTDKQLKRGESFFVEQSNRIRLETSLKVNKSGIYTCHLSVDYEYFGETETMETFPVSFIYLEGDEKDYKFNKEKIDKFHLEVKCEEENKTLYYDVDGRTLRFHDSNTIFWDRYYQDLYRLVNTIVVEDGTKEMEARAFWNVGMLIDVKTMYLPKSLERFDLSCFDLGGDLKTIYFGGTKEQWSSMVNNSENDRFDILEDVEIVYEYGPMPTKDEELQMHQNVDSYYELYRNGVS